MSTDEVYGVFTDDAAYERTTIRRWDGTSWAEDGIAPGLASGIDDEEAPDLFCLGAGDVWYVGPGVVMQRTASGWKRYGIRPWTGGGRAQLSARAPDDAWIVGQSSQGEGARSVARWDGSDWEQVTLPGDENDLVAWALAVSPDEAWLGGTGLLHWDGETLTVEDTGLGFDAGLYAAYSTGAGEVTLVDDRLRVYAWDRTTLTEVSTTQVGTPESPERVWLASATSGFAVDSQSIYEWDGAAWTSSAPATRSSSRARSGAWRAKHRSERDDAAARRAHADAVWQDGGRLLMHRTALFSLALVVALSGCLAISRSESSSEARASVVIEGGGEGGGSLCGSVPPGDGGSSHWIVVRSGEEHSELYVNAVLDSVLATAGAGGSPGVPLEMHESDRPGAAGESGGVEVQPLDCDLSDDPIDQDIVVLKSTPLAEEVCGFTVDAEPGSFVRVGVPGQPDVLPEASPVVVETFHVGPGARLAVTGDLEIYAEHFVLESGAEVRAFYGDNFSVLSREDGDAAADEPGRRGAWLTVIAEDAQLGGALVTRGNPGDATQDGGHGGRLVVFAESLTGALGAARAFPSGALDVRGGDGGDGLDAAPCDLTP